MSESTNIENFEQWKKIWDRNSEEEVRMGLLHCGLNTLTIQSVSFYFDLINSRNRLNYDDMLQKKAFTVLVDHFFGSKAFHLLNDLDLFYKFASFFQRDKCAYWVFSRSGSFWNMSLRLNGNREEKIKKFVLGLFEFSLDGSCDKRPEYVLVKARPYLLDIMSRMGVLNQVSEMYREKRIVPDERVLKKLLYIALYRELCKDVYIPNKELPSVLRDNSVHDRKFNSIEWFKEKRPRTLQEALFRGSQAAVLFVQLEAVKNELELLQKRILKKVEEKKAMWQKEQQEELLRRKKFAEEELEKLEKLDL